MSPFGWISEIDRYVDRIRNFPESLNTLDTSEKMCILQYFCNQQPASIKVPFFLVDDDDYEEFSKDGFRLLKAMHHSRSNFDEKYFLYPFDLILDLREFSSSLFFKAGSGSIEVLILANLNHIQDEASEPLFYIIAEFKRFLIKFIQQHHDKLYHILKVCDLLNLEEPTSFTSLRFAEDQIWLPFKRIIDMDNKISRGNGIQNPKLEILIQKIESRSLPSTESFTSLLFNDKEENQPGPEQMTNIITENLQEESENARVCVFCRTNLRTILAQECGHLVLCNECVNDDLESCPCCRKETKFIKLFCP